MSDLRKWKRDRREAMLSMDLAKVREYGRRWGAHIEDLPDDVLLCSIHKARTAMPELPMEERSKSKRWLLERGYEAFDDGDVPV